MRKKHLLISAFLLCAGVSYSQQSPLLEKYRSMALEYSHDLKSADKNISASIELEKAAKADWKPKLSECQFPVYRAAVAIDIGSSFAGTADDFRRP